MTIDFGRYDDVVSEKALREQLDQRRGTWPEIAASAGISTSWISQFVRRKFVNPGNATLLKVRDWLDANPVVIPASAATTAGGHQPSSSTEDAGSVPSG